MWEVQNPWIPPPHSRKSGIDRREPAPSLCTRTWSVREHRLTAFPYVDRRCGTGNAGQRGPVRGADHVHGAGAHAGRVPVLSAAVERRAP